MKVLIADDDPSSRHLLQACLIGWGYEAVAAAGGEEALAALDAPDAPPLVILDVVMPDLDGTEVCRRLRRSARRNSVYVILLTSQKEKKEVIFGFESGADDYVTKPFDFEELKARVKTGARVVELQNALRRRVDELEQLLTEVTKLTGLLSICSYCKDIRDQDNEWHQLEKYITERTATEFSHSVCPTCYEGVVKPELEKLKNLLNKT